MKHRWIVGVLSVLAAACNIVDPDPDPNVCQQTYEFGNYGCTRFVIIAEGPPQPWPATYRWDFRATPADSANASGNGFADHPLGGPATIHLVRYVPVATDTTSYWVRARILEVPSPIQVGVPLRVFAADSVLRVARFAGVGQRPRVDTVRLTLRKVNP